MTPLQRAKLMDATAYAREMSRFWGVETLVAMRMGCEELSYKRALIAFRWACLCGGYYREDA